MKWINRIIAERSLPGSTKTERRIEPEYEPVHNKLSDVVSMCLQKEFKFVVSGIDNIPPELLIKLLLLFRNIHDINPTFSIQAKIPIESKFNEKDSKEKKLFILNMLHIMFDAYLSDEAQTKLKIDRKILMEKLTQIMKIYYHPLSICHPSVYTMVSLSIPKFAAWAKKDPETKKEFCLQVEKWVTDNIIYVNRTIEEKANDIKDSVLYECLPHLPARILHSLSENHSDLIDKDLVVKLLWVYRKLQLFLDCYFKTSENPSSMHKNPKDIEFKSKYKDIFFSNDFDMKYEINDLHYSQVTIVYSMKLATVKVHEFDISILDDYLKLLDNIITYCKNEELSLLIYEIYECLLQSPKPNSLNVKIDLSLNKKGWLAC